jgi:hypothetical protein
VALLLVRSSIGSRLLARLALKLIFILTVPFLTLTIAAHVLGSTQPPNPALEGFTVGCEGKPQPCWYGIVPGVTTAHEAKAILTSRGFVSTQTEYPDLVLNTDILSKVDSEFGCDVSIGGNLGILRWTQGEMPVELLTVDCPSLTLGDVMLHLGMPDFVEFCGFSVIYVEGVTLDNNGFRLDTSPHNHVELSLWNERYIDGNLSTWHGFAPCWRYRQL